jgi:ubiquinone biosynthesis monooxygenase Coq7
VSNLAAVTKQAERQQATETVVVPDFMWPALRSDHAGETGAVYIYLGILSVARDDRVTCFARQHLATERRHLAVMETLVPSARRSRLVPVWRIAGWLTGALPALFGPVAVFRTIEAVENFVDGHYREQTSVLAADPQYGRLFELLERCRLDEVEHGHDAASRLPPPRLGGRLWRAVVGQGSRLGVKLAALV